MNGILCCRWHNLAPESQLSALKLFCWDLSETPHISLSPTDNTYTIIGCAGSHDPSCRTACIMAWMYPFLHKAPTKTWQLSTSHVKSFSSVFPCGICCTLLLFLMVRCARYNTFSFNLEGISQCAPITRSLKLSQVRQATECSYGLSLPLFEAYVSYHGIQPSLKFCYSYH